jgi:hypothetical protein
VRVRAGEIVEIAGSPGEHSSCYAGPSEDMPMGRFWTSTLFFALLLSRPAGAQPLTNPLSVYYHGFPVGWNPPFAGGLSQYHNGAIKSGNIDLYIIFYGSWNNPNYQYQYPRGIYAAPFPATVDKNLIADYFDNLGSSQYFKILQTYYDGNNNHPSGLTLQASWVVPAGPPYGNTLTDGAGGTLENLVHDQIKAHLSQIPHPTNSLFMVAATPDVTANGACGWHNYLAPQYMSDLGSGWGNSPPVFMVGLGDACQFNDDAAGAEPSTWFWHYPNSPLADLEVNELTHELFEAATDPYFSGWDEIGDICEPGGNGLLSTMGPWSPYYVTWASGGGPGGGHATTHVGSRDYRIQRMWVNRGGGYCDYFVRIPGDINADGKADLMNVDGYKWPGGEQDNVEYIATSTWGVPFNGTFNNSTVTSDFNQFSSQRGVRTFGAQFGFGNSGLLSFGGTGWNTVPAMAPQYGTSDGVTESYWVSNWSSDFNGYSHGNSVAVGDFFADGRSDVAALVSNNTGQLAILEQSTAADGHYISPWAATTTVVDNTMGLLGYAPWVVTGDFNGDGYEDIAAAGVNWWQTIPVAYSIGKYSFFYANNSSDFNTYASQPGAKVVAGDFNGDGFTDLLATGASGWNDRVYVALATGQGYWQPTQAWSSDFNQYSSQTGVKVFANDFDGDGRDDLVALGGPNWNTIPVALATSAGNLPFFSFASNAYNSLGIRASNGTSLTTTGWHNGPAR